MSRHPSPAHIPARRRPLADRLRGLLALLVMLALLVGIPLALYALRGNPLPDTGTDLSGLLDRLTAPDADGSLFLGALTWIGWLAWASFALTVLVEAVSQLRGLPTPHLPALGPQQRIAAGLVAAAALLFTIPLLNAAPALAANDRPTATPTTSSAASVSAPTAAPAPVQQQSRSAPAGHATRAYTVQPGDTLWQIATDQLGDGARFTEIAQLNYGVTQPDGHVLTTSHWLTPGWQLTLPDGTTTAAPAAAHEQTVVVEAGDTLWQIAQDHLGDGDRYPEIAAASTNLQDDGTRLVDPELIQPGWTLHLPGMPAPSAVAPQAPAAAPTPTAVTPPAADPAPESPAQSSAEQAAAASARAAQLVHTPAAAPSQVPAQDPDGDPETVRTAGGVGALLAASVLALLGLKRTRQQRRRRPGQRIAMPPPDLQSAELELRIVEDPTGLDRVDRALRSLSVLLATGGQPLPVLRLARLIEQDLELYLDGAAHLPAPFTATGDPTIWTLPADARLLSAEELAEVAGPFPSLVTIGHDLDNAHVLLDLEHAAALAVDGDPESSVAVLAAIAAELATSRWADDLQVTVVGCLPELPAAIGTGRVRHVETLGELLPVLERRAISIREFMAQTQIPDLQHARSAANQRPHSGAWYPEILLLGGPVDPADRVRLEDLLQELPRVSLAAVTAADSTPAEWTLVLDPNDDGPNATAVLRPVGLALRPQRLTTEDLDQLHDLLAVADLPSQDLPAHPSRPALIQAEPALSDLGSQLDGPTSTVIQLVPPTRGAEPDTTPQPESEREHATSEAIEDPTTGQDDPAAVDAPDELVSNVDSTQATEDTSSQSPEGPDGARTPLVQVLGPVAVLHARGPLEADRRGQLTEIAAFLALHPGLDHTHLDEAKWPGSRTLEKTRNTALNKLRRWLGSNDSDQEYVPYVDAGGYRLHAEVRSDWDLWQELLPEGPESASTEDLAAALELVKGQPFAGVKKRTYAWAERDKQDMISAIGDVAHELARRALLAGNATLARQAAAAGLQADPGAELLWRDALRAEWFAGDLAGLNSTADRLIDLASKLGDDLEPETDELLDELLSRTNLRAGTR